MSIKTKLFSCLKRESESTLKSALFKPIYLPTAYVFSTNRYEWQLSSLFFGRVSCCLGNLNFNLTLAYDDVIPAVINHQLLVIHSTKTIYDPPVDKL